jgi:hypothetical protein
VLKPSTSTASSNMETKFQLISSLVPVYNETKGLKAIENNYKIINNYFY